MIPRFDIKEVKNRLEGNTGWSNYVPPQMVFEQQVLIPPIYIHNGMISMNGYVDRPIQNAVFTPNIDESFKVDPRALRSFFKSRGANRFIMDYKAPPSAFVTEGTFDVDYGVRTDPNKAFTYLVRTLQHSGPRLLLIPLVNNDQLDVVLK
jgi:hypothetical protein